MSKLHTYTPSELFNHTFYIQFGNTYRAAQVTYFEVGDLLHHFKRRAYPALSFALAPDYEQFDIKKQNESSPRIYADKANIPSTRIAPPYPSEKEETDTRISVYCDEIVADIFGTPLDTDEYGNYICWFCKDGLITSRKISVFAGVEPSEGVVGWKVKIEPDGEEWGYDKTPKDAYFQTAEEALEHSAVRIIDFDE